MKRITPEEAKNYRDLTNDKDPFKLHRAVAFTITPISDEPGWEKVTYYEEIDGPKFSYISKMDEFGVRKRINYKK